MGLSGKEKIIWIIIFCILVVPPIGFSFEFTSFLYPKEIILSILLIFLLPFFLREKKEIHLPASLVLFFLLNIFLFLTCLYAKVPEQTWIRSAELFLVFLTLFFLTSFIKEEQYVTCIEYGILLSGIWVSISLIVQYYDILPVLFPEYPFYKQLYSVFGNQNLAGTYIAIVIVGILVRWDKIPIRDIIKLACFCILGYGLILSNSRSSWLSVLIVCIVFFFIQTGRNNRDKKRFIYLFGVIFIGILLTFPLIWERLRYSFSMMDVGFRVRLWVYDGSTRMILSNPLLGVGFGNFYYWSPRFLGEALNSSYGNIHIRNELLTLHAHNDILELIAETGLTGVPLVFLFYFSPLFLYRSPYVGWVFILLSFLNPILISSSHVIVAYLALFQGGQVCRNKLIQKCKLLSVGKKTKYFMSVLGLLSILFLAYALWLPDYKLRQAEKLLILGQDCEKQYQSLVHSKFATYAMYEGYAQELMRKGNYASAYEVLKKALDKTDGGNIYLLLGRCAEELGKEEEGKKWYRECLFRFPSNQEALEYLKSIGDLR